jgi:capsular exopolysaccharide synthesis family protein
MRFLKALQKAAETENPETGVRSEDEDSSVTIPGVLRNADRKIGGANSAVRRHSGTALEVVSERPGEGLDVFTGGGLETAENPPRPVFDAAEVFPENVNPHLVAITRPHSAYCEEYRSLRTQLLNKSQEQHLQAIVIASVGPGEGKSVTALNLAWLLAQTEGLTSLIIDCDLRRPRLTEYLGLRTEFGLSKVLDGHATLRESIIELKPAGLCLLPGGEPRGDVAELISGTRFRDILDETRRMFDYVIIDAPPLGVFTDAAILINEADGALLVVKANQTRYSDIGRVLASLPRRRFLGTILNQSEEESTMDGYYEYPQYKGLITA